MKRFQIGIVAVKNKNDYSVIKPLYSSKDCKIKNFEQVSINFYINELIEYLKEVKK